ncbi:50S ribosomal protein L22 [uncultured archaeon]|nr:50S ribosomal protein L22 [uncultured archaeon]
MYSYKFDDNVVGKARLEDVDASFKDLAEVCSNIRGKDTAKAIVLLEKAATGEMPIRYTSYITKLAHRKELGGKPGRYPKKSAKLVLGTLRSAIASAKAKGLSEDLVVVHAAANKKDVFPRLSPKGGKRTRSYYETARIEIVVREKNPTKKVEKKAEKKAEAKVPAPSVPKAAAPAKPAEAHSHEGHDHSHEGHDHAHPHVHETKVEAKAKKKQSAPKGEL